MCAATEDAALRNRPEHKGNDDHSGSLHHSAETTRVFKVIRGSPRFFFYISSNDAHITSGVDVVPPSSITVLSSFD